MAIFANQVKVKGAVRVSYFYPSLLPMVAVANIWLFIYTPMYGLLGYINPAWHFLTNPSTVLGALIVMLIWKQAGYVMIFYISGLQNINSELYEAARIDGANARQTFWKITWPMLKPTTLYVMIITLTNAYKMVDHLYIMTSQGRALGNSSNMLLFYCLQKAFDQSNTQDGFRHHRGAGSHPACITCVQFFTQDKRDLLCLTRGKHDDASSKNRSAAASWKWTPGKVIGYAFMYLFRPGLPHPLIWMVRTAFILRSTP